MTTATGAPTAAQTLDLTTLDLAALRESVDNELDYPDEPGFLALAEDVCIAWTPTGVAVIDVPGFLQMWGLPVTHARAAEIRQLVKARRITPLLPAVTTEDCRRDLDRAQDRADRLVEHGCECDCRDCRYLRPIVDVSDLPIRALEAELTDTDRAQAEEAGRRA